MKTMNIRVLAFLMLLMMLQYSTHTAAQQQLPVLKSGDVPIDIRDGKHLKNGFWRMVPERKPDDYYVEIPESAHKVTFITDQDSLAFNVEYNHEYNFIILRDGKDSCYTRIVTRYKDDRSLLHAPMTNSIPDTLPFHLGENGKLYLNGQLNGSPVKNCQLDLGSGGIVINESSIPKVRIQFDQKTMLSNSDGVNEVPLSTINQLKLGKLTWDSLPVLMAKNLQPAEDLVLGNALFKNRILEIDYNKQILIIRDTLPLDIQSYTKLNLILDQGIIPYIPVHLNLSDSTLSGWVMFDTGAWTTILNNNDATMTLRLMVQLASLIGLNQGFAPSISMANYQMKGFHFKTREMGKVPGLRAILGIDLLHRFNMVLDNRNGYMYLKPNSFWTAPYKKPDEYYAVRITGTILLIFVCYFLYKRIKKIRRRQNQSVV
ncbi:aspartyl protease family protein [Arachidicoccus rhizosphaerae]|nr:aspartyl protease family protein [Arachidicoccus rhizosphaerae]